MEKEKEIEVDPAIEATARNGIRYVTSFGMVNVRKERTVPTNMSRIPQDLGPPKKKGKGSGRSASPSRKSKEEMAKIPCAYFQQGKWSSW